MASPIIPKSEIRKINSISHGYGEVPAATVDGKKGWALPGNVFTTCENTARKAAMLLDKIISQNMRDPRQLMS